jgi:hypothetical protein
MATACCATVADDGAVTGTVAGTVVIVAALEGAGCTAVCERVAPAINRGAATATHAAMANGERFIRSTPLDYEEDATSKMKSLCCRSILSL